MNSKTANTLPLSLLVLVALLCAAFVSAAPTQAAQGKSAKVVAARYSCPMHPEVKSSKPGWCPKCGMNLRATSEADTATSPATAAPTTGMPTADAPKAEEKGTGDLSSLRIPDASVLDQNGRRLNFYTDLVKGKTVAINFIFTTCTTICPPLTATFRRVQQNLGERVGRDVELISISVDPATDVPERLKEFSAKFKAGAGWTFVTGSKPEIDRLLSALGGYVADKNDHTPLILIGNDAAHKWTRTYGLAPASQITQMINDAASKNEAQGKSEAEGKSQAAVTPTTQTGGAQATQSSGAAADAAAKYFSNTVLLTQDNKPVRFYDDLLKGKVVLVNFFFANCRGVCSPMTANLAKVQKYLGERVGQDVLMLSISVDPEADTPAVLKKYAESFKAQPGWYFLTGEKRNVDWVLYKLGGYVEDKQQHSSVLIMGNVATGEWMKVLAMSNPSEIADAALKLSSKKE